MFSETVLAGMRGMSERAMVNVVQVQGPVTLRGTNLISTTTVYQTVKTYQGRLAPLSADEVEDALAKRQKLDFALVLPWNAEVSADQRAIVDGDEGGLPWRRWLVLKATNDPRTNSVQQRWLVEEVAPWQ